MQNDDAIAALIEGLVEHLSGAGDDWDSLAMVISFDGDRFTGTYGYAYSPSGEILAVASRPSAIRPLVNTYIESRCAPGERLPVKLLLQFDRKKGEHAVTVEDLDATRWKVTAENYSEIREELRPRL
ncbi:hypothetical protein ACTU6U_00760 [Microbacterium sp. A196]|uniref:hypothetical protein n=1 Tax=unclassified Microbacterium TaxID=2609290 RepID=UPI003FD5C4D6